MRSQLQVRLSLLRAEAMSSAAQHKTTISRAARQAGVHVETIRYYERIGLLARRRPAGGYRVYSRDEVERLRFIRHCQSFGFSLKEIRELLDLRDDDGATCVDVCGLAGQKVSEIESKIRALRAVRDELKRIIRCRSLDRAAKDCDLLQPECGPRQ